MTNIYADGSGYNGREWKWCVKANGSKPVIARIQNEKVTNNHAEYIAVIEAMERANEGDNILTDSKLIIGHIYSGWNCQRKSIRMRDEIAKLIEEKNLALNWVPREDNKAGIVLDKVNGR